MKKGGLCALSAALCLALVLALTAASYSLRPDDEGARTRLEGFYGEPRNTLDAVLVGSSAAYMFFSPMHLYEKTGLASCLVATANQSVQMLPFILEECLKRQPQALYVIELRPMLASRADLEAIGQDVRRLTDNMPYSLNRFRCIEALAPEEERLFWHLDLIKYHGRWKEVQLQDLRLFWGRPDPMKGFQFIEGIERIEKRSWKTNARIAPDKDCENALRELLSLCRRQNVRALFVATPFSLSREQQKKYNAVGDIVSEYGYEFLDMNRCVEEIGLDFDTDYCDFRHTNTAGALKATEYLAEVLEARIVPQRRADRAKWDADMRCYLAKEQESLRLWQRNLEGEGNVLPE